MRLIVVAAATVGTASAVAVSGLIAFVGIIVPHTIRLVVSTSYRAVPDRYRSDPDFDLTDAQWDDLQVPVAMAFFFHNSVLDRIVAHYPSPAGATESLLDLAAWDDIVARTPLAAELSPDVEALIVRRSREGNECFLVPIDACYELVGRVRMRWSGFDGGPEARRDIDDFFVQVVRLPYRSG